MFIACIIAVIIVDQVIKYYIRSTMLPGMSFPVIPNIFSITYIQNAGAAFGILEDQRLFFIIATILVLVCGIYFYPVIRRQALLLRLGTALLLGGAAGNLIDRIRFGIVIDYCDFHIWPIFNIADTAIVFGVIIIIYYIYTRGLPE
ncbi:signal peptidase II [Pectinatus cerevisiiphilus]|uniref:Lipoprotein signal peptidase n=1 Tax=Pectinatus cerevisiiphilus TaxID=86956 RepID=A0A4R3K7C2_9FIRM|nr:signal peptidase II [Pectinatus cerevisiiphilus]TCS78737.1 signal peptidase II [Pectinatus cerevisiiphilus]